MARDVGGVHGVPGRGQEAGPRVAHVDGVREDEDGSGPHATRGGRLVGRVDEDTPVPLRVDGPGRTAHGLTGGHSHSRRRRGHHDRPPANVTVRHKRKET